MKTQGELSGGLELKLAEDLVGKECFMTGIVSNTENMMIKTGSTFSQLCCSLILCR